MKAKYIDRRTKEKGWCRASCSVSDGQFRIVPLVSIVLASASRVIQQGGRHGKYLGTIVCPNQHRAGLREFCIHHDDYYFSSFPAEPVPAKVHAETPSWDDDRVSIAFDNPTPTTVVCRASSRS